MGSKNEIIRSLRAEVSALRGAAGEALNFQNSQPPASPLPPPPGVSSGAVQMGQVARMETLNNSLTSLVQGAAQQSRLTSLTPMITNNLYYPVTMNYLFLMYAYKTHGILQTAIDMPVLDAFRGGIEIIAKELDSEDLEGFNAWMEEKMVLRSFADSIIWKRLFGGSALIINTPQNPSTPLDFTKVDKDHLEFYDAVRWELAAPSMRQEFYTLYDAKLHKSRVMVMSGKRAPWLIRNQLSGWGMSEIERMISAFNLHLQTDNVIYEILDEAKVDVYGIEGFAESLATNDGTALIKSRIALTNQMKNFHNALLLDKNDSYDQKQLSFSGLADMKKENRIAIASALRMPLTKLFGLSAAGFNSGEDDIENYNAMVESEVREPAKPELRKVLKMCLHAYFGNEIAFDFKFKPLRMMTSQEEEQIKASKQQRAEALFDKALVTSKELGEILHKEDLITIDTAMQRGELEDHPLAPVPGMEEGGGGDEEGDGKNAGAGPWHRSPKGRMRKKLKSGRYEYKKDGAQPK